MIRVAHLVTGLSVGGAEMNLHRIVTRLDRKRIASTVVSMTGPGPVGEFLERQGIKTHSLGMKRGSLNPMGLIRLTRLLRKERPDILQTWLYHSDLLGLVSSRFAGRIPLIWNLRCSDMDPKEHSKTLFRMIRILARYSESPAAVVINSQAGKAVHEERGYRPRRWELIYNGFDMEEFHPMAAREGFLRELGLEEGVELVGQVARYDPMKDHPTFLRAAAALAKKRSGTRFVLMGEGMDGSNETMVNLIRDLGLDGKIFLLGRRDDVVRITSALDVAVSSSAYGEGFSNALGEAMACATPCVATDVGDSARIVGDTGCVVPPRAPDALAEALDRILSMDRNERRALGMRARARIEERFSMSVMIRSYETLYEEVAAAAGR